MVIYNVTVKVDWSIAEDWIIWAKTVHIPEVMLTGCFSQYHLTRLLETDEEEGPTYVVQYFADSLSRYDEYLNKHAPLQRQKTIDAWGDKFIAFRSVMQSID